MKKIAKIFLEKLWKTLKNSKQICFNFPLYCGEIFKQKTNFSHFLSEKSRKIFFFLSKQFSHHKNTFLSLSIYVRREFFHNCFSYFHLTKLSAPVFVFVFVIRCTISATYVKTIFKTLKNKKFPLSFFFFFFLLHPKNVAERNCRAMWMNENENKIMKIESNYSNAVYASYFLSSLLVHVRLFSSAQCLYSDPLFAVFMW